MQTTGFKSSASMKFGDRLFGTLAKSFAWLTLILLAGIILALVYASWPSIQAFGIGFLFSDAWNPPMEDFGGLIPIYGTLVTSAIALLIAVPVSFGIALFLTEMAPAWLRRPPRATGSCGRARRSSASFSPWPSRSRASRSSRRCCSTSWCCRAPRP